MEFVVKLIVTQIKAKGISDPGIRYALLHGSIRIVSVEIRLTAGALRDFLHHLDRAPSPLSR